MHEFAKKRKIPFYPSPFFFNKEFNQLSRNPTLKSLSNRSKTPVYKDVYTRIFIILLFIEAKIWKDLKYPRISDVLDTIMIYPCHELLCNC